MATSVEKIKDQETSTDEEAIFIPYRDSRNAELAFYKAQKRGFEPDCELEDWPDEDLKNLLYEMSTEASVNGSVSGNLPSKQRGHRR